MACPEVRHQAGARLLDEARAAYAAAGIAAEVVPYIDDMAAAYAWADLVVCRSGAMTVSEVAAAGLAAVLVPFPAATDDHQTANARWLSDAGAAVLLPQAELTDASLAALLTELGDRERLIVMAEKARAIARLDAVPRLVAGCEALVPTQPRGGA
jgi:UDP-N-acetylglucosamine--N-acetylmuramyl-(pentapeptide) pyrophosphoryl-undecaprenol N-acetylglucosamine transferase